MIALLGGMAWLNVNYNSYRSIVTKVVEQSHRDQCCILSKRIVPPVMPRLSSPTPLVTVVIPVYNGAEYIERTLRSVLQQTYENIEVLVVNDGSTDRTAEIVAGMARNDSRVKVFHQENQGVAAARNRGIHESRGELIGFIDADDLWHPENLDEQVACFQSSGASVGLVYSWSFDIDQEDRPLGTFSAATIEGFVCKTLMCHYFIGNGSASLIGRDCLTAVGGYDCGLRAQSAQGCEDVDLALRIAERYEFRAVPRFLVAYRKHIGSISADYDHMARSHDIVISRFHRRHPEIPGVLTRIARSSMALYLAKQAIQNSDRRRIRQWVRRAFAADPLSSLLRPDFYRAFLASLFRRRMRNQTQAPRIDPQHPMPRFDARKRAVRSKVFAATVASRLIELRAGGR